MDRGVGGCGLMCLDPDARSHAETQVGLDDNIGEIRKVIEIQ
jgi:hypothetical protein